MGHELAVTSLISRAVIPPQVVVHELCCTDRCQQPAAPHTYQRSSCAPLAASTSCRRARAAVHQPCMAYSLHGPSWPTLIQINPTKIPPSAPPASGVQAGMAFAVALLLSVLALHTPYAGCT